MSIDLLEEIKKSKEAFLDLSKLGPPELSAIVQRALYHLEELKEGTKQLYQISPEVTNLLIQGLTSKIDDTLVQSQNITSISTNFRPDCTIESWQNISDIEDSLIRFLNEGPFQGKVDIDVSPTCLKLSGDVVENIDINSFRTVCYSETKSLLSKKILLTYDLGKRTSLRLSFRFRDDEEKKFYFPLEGNNFVSIDGRFGEYLLDFKKNISFETHVYIRVSKTGKAVRLEKIPDHIQKMSQNENFVLINFPFRHVLISFPKNNSKLHTDLENKPDYFIDLFSLISK